MTTRMTKMTASDVATLRLTWGDAPSANFAKWFPDSDPTVIALVEKWQAAAKLVDEAQKLVDEVDAEIEALARAEGWISSSEEEAQTHLAEGFGAAEGKAWAPPRRRF